MKRQCLAFVIGFVSFSLFAQSPFSFYSGGDRFIEAPFRAEYAGRNSITVEFWMKADSLPDCFPLSSAQDNGGDESGFYFGLIDGKLRFFLKTEKMGANEWNSNPGAAIKEHEWHHAAGTYDGSRIVFYLDGRNVASKNVAGNVNWQFKPRGLFIGKFLDDNEDVSFKGHISELRLWGIARSEQEIQSTMRKSLSGRENGLLGYWKLDGLADGKVVDSSPLRNDGIIKSKQAW